MEKPKVGRWYRNLLTNELGRLARISMSDLEIHCPSRVRLLVPVRAFWDFYEDSIGPELVTGQSWEYPEQGGFTEVRIDQVVPGQVYIRVAGEAQTGRSRIKSGWVGSAVFLSQYDFLSNPEQSNPVSKLEAG